MSLFHHRERWGGAGPRLTRGFAAIIMLTSFLTLIGQGFSKDVVKTDAKGRKYVNKIPYDVFFDNPLEVVNSNKSAVPVAETASTPAAKTTPVPAAAQPAPKAGETDWQDLVPMDILQGEVKQIRNSLTKSMTNQGAYSQNFKVIATDGAELSALAGIVQQHPESIGWKDKAQYVRDFGAQLNQNAVGLGKDNFEKTKTAYQKLTSVFDGSVPADAGDIPSTRPFHEYASRKGLMRRIERAKDWLKQDVNSEAKFKSMSEQIQHEAAILAALAKVLTTNGYEFAENDDYQQFAKSLIDGAREAANSSKEESYDQFKQAIDKVNKSCTDCHGNYGSGQ